MRECRLRNKASILLALVAAAAVLGSSLTHAAEPAQKVVRLGFVHSQSASTTNRGLSGFWERSGNWVGSEVATLSSRNVGRKATSNVCPR